MRATSPSGNAAYAGRAQWSGELGYGVRAAEAGQSATPDLTPPVDVDPLDAVDDTSADGGHGSDHVAGAAHTAPGGSH